MLVDTHIHLDSYDDKIQKAIDEIETHNIIVLDVAMNPGSYLFSKKLEQQCEFIIPCFGIHPFEAYKYHDKLESFEPFITETVSIGEIGLDFHWCIDESQYSCQRKVFDFFMERAGKLSKVVNLHTKGAEKEILEKIKYFNLSNPIIHWYSGPEKLIKKFLDAGAYFTVGVELAFSQKIQSVLKRIPDDRLLLETDNTSGYEWLTGEVPFPLMIDKVADDVAGYKEYDKRQLIKQTFLNFKDVFAGNEKVLSKLNKLNRN